MFLLEDLEPAALRFSLRVPRVGNPGKPGSAVEGTASRGQWVRKALLVDSKT